MTIHAVFTIVFLTAMFSVVAVSWFFGENKMSADKYDANLRPQMDSREGFGLYGEWPAPEVEEPTELEDEFSPDWLDDWKQ
jgi:hypothetical protein